MAEQPAFHNRETEFRREIQQRIESQTEVDRWLADLKRRK
jgi:hypothetical protein